MCAKLGGGQSVGSKMVAWKLKSKVYVRLLELDGMIYFLSMCISSRSLFLSLYTHPSVIDPQLTHIFLSHTHGHKHSCFLSPSIYPSHSLPLQLHTLSSSHTHTGPLWVSAHEVVSVVSHVSDTWVITRGQNRP